MPAYTSAARKESPVQRIGAFITPHGFGHATRTIAVLEALQHRIPDLAIEICTTVSGQLFAESLDNLTIHRLIPDIGLIQKDALRIDLAATARALDGLLPFADNQINRLADTLSGCNAILCDIAPLGILVAERAGIPSVLVENFTWDWIYQPYIAKCPELEPHARALAEIYNRATLHIQVEPVCNALPGRINCPTVFRRTRNSPENIRRHLGAGQKKIVVISLGGINFQMPGWQQMHSHKDCFFVLAGQPEHRLLTPNSLAISRHSAIYHPDLIGAAELVVFKSGYSTVAECLQTGTRAVCITRPSFAESKVLARFVENRLEGTLLLEEEFLAGTWIDNLPQILSRPRPLPATINGAECIAEQLITLFYR